MCFSVPYKVIKVDGDVVYVEGNKVIKLGKEIRVKKGGFLQVIGNVAVGSLSPKEGQRIRKLIKSLNKYEQKN